MASANWFTRATVAPVRTSSSGTATSAKVTTYSSEPLAVGVAVTVTPAACGDTTTTPLSVVTSSHCAVSA